MARELTRRQFLEGMLAAGAVAGGAGALAACGAPAPTAAPTAAPQAAPTTAPAAPTAAPAVSAERPLTVTMYDWIPASIRGLRML